MKCPKCKADVSEDSHFCSKCGMGLKDSAEGISLTKTLITPKDSLKEGSTVGGRYTIIEELGRGGMGVVYKAQDTKLKRTVALKFLPSELTHIPEVKTRFMHEAQAAAALDHPNICTVHEFEQADESSFISMAYIEGQSIREKIEAGPLGLEEAMRIAGQVAEGLHAAHQKGIVHRDIKSANIMVTDRGQAKIMDFGLARTAEKTLLTKEGTTMGTIAYMSPEQARGKEVDHRTDIWSFGVVLYEMLTGELPFKGEHEQAVVYSIRKDKPGPITEVNTEIPSSIEQVVDKALEKDADKRYQQVDELLDDLKSISAGIVPEEIKVRLRKAKLRRRKRTILYAGAAGLVIALVVIALNLSMGGRVEAIESIAVLPFENLTGDAGQEYFVDGATDEMIGQLAKIGAWRVISRRLVMQYKGVDKPLAEIARELNVDAVVEGTVYQAGESVRLRVQLIDVLPEEQNLWADTYDRPMTDVLIMYSEMARAIAGKTQIYLSAEEMTRLTSASQVNPESYDAYLKGMSHWYKLTPQELGLALQYFDLASQIDPNNALAHSGVARVWGTRALFGLAPPDEAVPLATSAAEKSLELDNTLAEAHFVLAGMRAWCEWKWKSAEPAFQQALRLNPNFQDAHAYYALHLSIMGRTDEAMPHIERALQLDPLSELFHALHANVLHRHHRYDEAITAARTALEMQPNQSVAHAVLQYCFILKGMRNERLADQRQSIAHDAERLAAFEHGLEAGGYEGALRAIADVLAARYEKVNKVVDPSLRPMGIALLYFDAGDYDLTMDWLEKAYQRRDLSLSFISSPLYVPLRSYPRFQELLRKMNLPVDEKE